MDLHFHQKESYRKVGFFCSLTTVVVAAAVLIGWAADIGVLKSVLPNYPEMKIVTATGFILLGVALSIVSLTGAKGWSKILTGFVGAIIASAACAMIALLFVHSSNGPNASLLPGLASAPGEAGGQISRYTAVNFLLLGLSFLLLNGRFAYRQLSGAAAVLAAITTYAVILSHLYHANQFYGFPAANGMGLHTAALFLLVSAGLVWQNRDFLIVRLLASNSVGGTAARRLTPIVVLIPTAIGWLRVVGQDRGLYDTGFGTTVSMFVIVILMLSIVLFYSSTVHRSDEKRRRAEADLADKEMRYRELFDYSQGLICIHDLDGVLTTVNRAALDMLGYGEDEMIGKNLRELVSADHKLSFDAYLRQVTHGGLASGLLELRSKSGKSIVLRYNNVLASEDGVEPYILGHAQNVTELLEAQRQLKNLSLTDELTGLYNRRGFLTLAEQQIKLEMHNGTARGLTLLFADMDGLKSINDTYGHEAGSEALVTLGRLIKSAVRDADIVARWGGDEFVILTVGAQGESSGIMVDRIRDRIDEYNEANRENYIIACSIGVAPIEHNRSFDDTIAEADRAMYAEKKRRKAARGQINSLAQPSQAPDAGSVGRA